MANEFEALGAMDQDALMSRMAAELPEIREKLGIKLNDLADKIDMEEGKLRQIEAGKRNMKWSEFMSLLFIIWSNDVGRNIVESKGLFPDALKNAMSVNRNAHECIWRLPTAAFAEQNGRNAKLIGRRPLFL